MEDLLELIAQLAITIAALSAVAGATRGDNIDRENQYLLRDVALIGMAVALYSVVPLLLDEAGVDGDLIVTACGSLAALCWFAGYIMYVKRIWGDKAHFNRWFFFGMLVTLSGLAALSYAALFGNDIAYLAGLVFFLSIAGLNFINGVFNLTPVE